MKKNILLLTLLFLLTAQVTYAAYQFPVNCSGGTWVPNGDGTQRCVTNASTGNGTGNTGVAQGQGRNLDYTPLEPIPGVTTNSSGTALDFPHLVGRIYYIAIIIGALFSVLMLTISGIRYMLSDVVTDKARAIQRIKACIYGLILIAASWLVLNTINPQLVTFSLNPCPQGNCAITGGQQNNNLNNPPAQNCGNYGACNPATTYCGTINGETSCIPNEEQSAQKSCSDAGGTWSNNAWNGSYCWLSANTTKESCEAPAVGGAWYCPGALLSCYCRK